jgi:6-phosphogluconate dehydrogenase
MEITAELSMYPLDANYKPPIIDFILDLRQQPGIEIVTNQLATQLRGEFAAVTAAINHCMLSSMQQQRRVVFTVKYLNVGLEIAAQPKLDIAAGERDV